MKVNDILRILAISQDEWDYFSRLLDIKAKEALMDHLPFLSKESLMCLAKK